MQLQHVLAQIEWLKQNNQQMVLLLIINNVSSLISFLATTLKTVYRSYHAPI